MYDIIYSNISAMEFFCNNLYHDGLNVHLLNTFWYIEIIFFYFLLFWDDRFHFVCCHYPCLKIITLLIAKCQVIWLNDHSWRYLK